MTAATSLTWRSLCGRGIRTRDEARVREAVRTLAVEAGAAVSHDGKEVGAVTSAVPGVALWHLLLGIDLTAWSPPHLFLIASAALQLGCVLGLLRQLRTKPRDATDAAGLLILVLLGAILYIAVTVALSLGYVAPAARLANGWDTRLGGALADAVSCNAVVKAFGAESREEARLALILDKWRGRTARAWVRGTNNAAAQTSGLVLLRTAVIGMALILWWRGRATPGDVTDRGDDSAARRGPGALLGGGDQHEDGQRIALLSVEQLLDEHGLPRPRQAQGASGKAIGCDPATEEAQ